MLDRLTPIFARSACGRGPQAPALGGAPSKKGLTMSTTQIRTPEVEIDKIDIRPGFNSRKHFDRDDLEALAETIKVAGVVNPVRLQPSTGGRY